MPVCKLLLFLTNRGIIPPDYNPSGSCLDGYQGILCADCEPGYSQSGSFQCQLCPDPASNIVKLIGVAIAFIIVILFMIRSTLKGASEVRNITSVYQKILLNHV